VPRHDSVAATTGEIQARPARRPRGIASWPIRRKLVALVTLPLLVVLAAGAIFATTATRSYLEARRVRQLSEATVAAFNLGNALNAEFNGSIAVTRPPDAAMARMRATVDRDVTAFEAAVAHLPAGVASDQSTQTTILFTQTVPSLTGLRESVDAGRPVILVDSQFNTVLTALSNTLESLTTDVTRQTNDTTTKTAATTLNYLNRGTTAATRERSVLLQGLRERRLSQPRYLQLLELTATQTLAFDAAAQVAFPAQRPLLDTLRAGDPQMDAFRAEAPRLAQNQPATGDPAVFDRLSQARLQEMAALITAASTDLSNGTTDAERSSLIRSVTFAGVALLLLALVGVTVSRIARSIIGPLRLLRAGATDTAHVNLPRAVAQIEEEGPEAAVWLEPVLPPGTATSPETIDVAKAVDDLGGEALRLAASQVRLRRTLDDAFVSMSRRSQSMVEKQLAIIDELESTEEDPDQLRNLFRLDHLAARMRRYNDNLLVLAGSAMRSRTSGPIRVAELFRAATSEMEQYERVRLQPVGGAAISGTVAGELIHLLAELLDNAAMYSPPSSSIVLSAAFTSGGGMHIEVVDSGVGIPGDEIDRLNTRLSSTDTLDLQAHSRIGLFVVARLAQRGGFLVNLRPRSDATGTVAQVLVPHESVIGAPGSTAEHAPVAAGNLPGAPSWAVQRPESGVGAIPPGLPYPAAAPDDRSEPAVAGPNGPARSAEGTSPLPRRPKPAPIPPPAPGLQPVAETAEPEEPAPVGLVGDGEEFAHAGTGDLPVFSDALAAAEDSLPAATGWPPTPPPPNGILIGDQVPEPYLGTGPLSLQSPQTGDLKPVSNPAVPAAPLIGLSAWDEELPTELAARVAASSSYRPADPATPLIGVAPEPGTGTTPIFDSISAWFSAPDRSELLEIPRQETDTERARSEEVSVIDIRDGAERAPRAEEPVVAAAAAARWGSLGDQRWLAASAQAAAAPEIAGRTTTGLPLRRPGANLVSSAEAAAPPRADRTAAATGPSTRDAAAIRGRLGSYQRGLASARRARPEPTGDEFGPFDPVGVGLFTGQDATDGESTGQSTDQGGDR